jgi:hypothetical protein
VEAQTEPEEAAMNATAAARPEPGQQKVLATYECDEGARQLVGQRIDGQAALSDIPASDHGRVYLIERQLPCQAELDGLVADYLALAAQLGRPPLRHDWILDR